MKVYVLVCESIYDMCDETISCAVFPTKERAIAQMKKEYESSMDEWDGEDYVHEIYEGEFGNSAVHYEDGRFSETHVQWEVFEKELEIEEEVKSVNEVEL